MHRIDSDNEIKTLADVGDLKDIFCNGLVSKGPTFTGPTSDAGIRIKAIEGKSVQAVSHGYQLAPIPQHYEKNGGFSVSGTSITFDGTLLSSYADLVYEIKHLKTGVLRMKCKNETQRHIVLEIKRNQSETSDFLGELIFRAEGNGKAIDWQCNVTDPSYHYYAKVRVSDPTGDGGVMEGTISDLIFYQDGDGTYEPYTGGKAGPQPEYPIPIESVKITKLTGSEGEETLTTPIVLRSLPDGTKDEYRDGKVIRRVKEVTFDGSADESWMQAEAYGVLRFCAIITGCKVSSPLSYFPVCSSGTAKGDPSLEKGNNFIYFSDSSGNVQFYFVPGNENASDVASFKTWLATHPITILYPLATPTIETSPLPIVASSAPSGTAQTDSAITPTITWEALPAGSCALEVQELRKRIEELESEVLNNAQN